MKAIFLVATLVLASDRARALTDQDVKISTDLNDVKFFLWTPEYGPSSPLVFQASASARDLLSHGFHSQRQTKIISHGWNSDGESFCRDYVEAYFSHSHPEYNVIGIEWSRLATWDNYFTAAKNAINIGQHAGRVLGNLLIQELNQSPFQIHAIGHSLGSHLVGHLGRTIESEFGQGKISRVTALDPAAPWFDVTSTDNRVSKNDALLVDAIHTNSGSLFDLCLSFMIPLGHIDFYPNGGSHQAGCNDVCLASICTESNLIDLFNGACSHGRVNDFYVESIYNLNNNDAFLGQKCDTWFDYEFGLCNDDQKLRMGEGLDINSVRSGTSFEGKYFLHTNKAAPYSDV